MGRRAVYWSCSFSILRFGKSTIQFVSAQPYSVVTSVSSVWDGSIPTLTNFKLPHSSRTSRYAQVRNKYGGYCTSVCGQTAGSRKVSDTIRLSDETSTTLRCSAEIILFMSNYLLIINTIQKSLSAWASIRLTYPFACRIQWRFRCLVPQPANPHMTSFRTRLWHRRRATLNPASSQRLRKVKEHDYISESIVFVDNMIIQLDLESEQIVNSDGKQWTIQLDMLHSR